MKKMVIPIVALLVALVITLLVALYQAGYREGIRHAIEDSVIFTVECYDPENPDENVRDDGTDQTIYIDLDGNLYERGMYQG